MEQEKIVKNKSAYILFCLDERPVVKKDNPDIKNRDILVELGKRWKLHKGEGSERFKGYEARALEDKNRYLSEKGDSVQVKVVKEKVVKEKVVKEKVVKEKKPRKSAAKVEAAPVPEPEPVSEPVPAPVPAPEVPVVAEPAPAADKKVTKRTSKKQK